MDVFYSPSPIPNRNAVLEKATPTHRPTVLVYRRDMLPHSETFIREQMLAYRKWRGVLIGRRLLSALPLDGLNVRGLQPVPSNLLSRYWWRMSRKLGGVPFPVLARLRGEAPSLLHAHFGVDAIDAWPIARALDLPMVVTLHGYDINIHRQFWESGRCGEWFGQYPRRLLAISAERRVHFIAVSEAIRQKAIKFGISSEKISVRYIGVDVRRFMPIGRPIAQRQRRVLFVGRLVEKKGCEFLIRAMAEVQKFVADAQLVIVGDGELRDPLRRLAVELGVQCEFLGALSSDEIKSQLALARIFCLPSVTTANGDAEGLPIVLLEALSSGVPVVTSEHSGSSEVVSDDTGLLSPERDCDSLTQQITRLLTNDSIASSMSYEGRAHVIRNFDIRRCAEKLEDLYSNLSATE